jgi:hypothetical protein
VRYQIDEPFVMMAHCHCSMCRKHHGAAFATFAGAQLGGFRWQSGKDDCVPYQSSAQGLRSFCRTCGSVTPMLLEGMGMAVVPAGNLQGDPGIRPQMHIFVGSKAPWYAITDTAPQHAGFPPEWGGGMGLDRPVVAHPGVTHGTCLCGDVAFEVTGAATRAYHCHCSRCRRARSAAHASNFFFALDGFRYTRGEDRIAEYKVPEARFFTAAFCRRCGGKVPRVARERGVATVPGGCLDSDPGARPTAHIYVGSKAPWFEITDDLPRHEESPPPA